VFLSFAVEVVNQHCLLDTHVVTELSGAAEVH
jgi:hypothetical protein